MSFDRLSFTKNWTNPTDFPTVESDEAQVRADMQILHDEAKEGLNGLMDQLEQASAAASLGAQAVDGSGKSTLQQELNAIYSRMEEKLASITAKSLGALRVAAGSYTGSGTFGTDNRNSLTFDFEPYLVVIRSNGAGAPVVFVKGANAKFTNPKSNVLGESLIRVIWGSDNVSWYADTYTSYAAYGDSAAAQGSVNAAMQLNAKYLTYNWVAIGL